MRTPDLRNERGIALVVAIVALVVIGAIVGGTFFMSTLEQQTAVNTVETSQAYQAAEAGVQKAIATWQPTYNALGPDASVALTRDSVYGGNYFDVTLSRLNQNFFLVRSVGTERSSTQTLAAVVRLMTANPDIQAAVTAHGDVQIGGNATVTGSNSVPPNWSCTASPDRSGIRTDGTVSTTGHSYTLTGSPATVQNDPSISSATFTTPFNQLKSLATLTLAGGTYTGMAPRTIGSPAACNRASTLNWGEPWREPTGGTVTQCVGYAPVVLFTNDAHLSNGRGQGVLLVQGDLQLSGNFEYTGLVITTGQVRTTGTGNKVTGAVMAQGVNLNDQTSFLGDPTVAYSRCAVEFVLQQSAVARPVAGRAWTQVF
jgi:Tfp pilus assembly protein PilX